MNDLETIATSDLVHVTGSAGLPLALTPDHQFNNGAFLTEALRRGMHAPATHGTAPSPHHVTRSTTNPGWCDDGFGIVPCR